MSDRRLSGVSIVFPRVEKIVDIFSKAWKILPIVLALAAPAVYAADCVTLADATHAPAFSWTTGGDAEWFAQTNMTREADSCAAQSGAIDHDELSYLQTEVSGGGMVSFYWKVSSEAGWDELSFYINGHLEEYISGEVDWEQRQYDLAGGVSTLAWVYAKDDVDSAGADTGWMTDFHFQPFTGRMARVSGNLAFGRVEVGSTSQLVVTALNPGDEATTVSGVTLPAGYSAQPTNFAIGPGAETPVTVTFAPLVPGMVTGMLTLVSDAQSGSGALPVSGQGFIPADRFVATNSPSPAAPYTNWSTAAHTLQAALDYAGEGDTVWVTNGVYDLGTAVAYGCSNRAVVGTGVVLRSVNGPAVTHIVGAADPDATNEYGIGPAAVRGVALFGNAALDGFTVRDGSVSEDAYYGGGVLGEDQAHTEAPYLSQVRNCIIVSNAAEYGGGLAMVFCENVRVEYNRAAEWGGGINRGAASQCRIAHNSADTAGGAYYVSMSNCMILANTAKSEGGGVVGAWPAMLKNCTVVGNSALVCGGISRSTAHNSLIYYNTAPTYPNYAPAGLYYGTYLFFCASTPLAEGNHGTNNIADEPRIVSLMDPHLLADSPCLNAGTNQDWVLSALDFDGDPRWNGDRVDIGADEFWANSLTDTLHVAIGLPVGGTAALNYPLPLRADIAGRCEQTLWELDGVVITNTPLFHYTFTHTGDYEVRLSASNLLGVVSAVVTVSVEDVAFYVATNGSDAADGQSWATAKQTIQAAVDACVIPGGVVWVSNGVYNTGGRVMNEHSNRVVVTNAITVRSVNGPDVTRIHGATDPGSTNAYNCGSNAVRGVYLSGGASLFGFTVAGGRSSASGWNRVAGGILCISTEETISNCVVVGNAAILYGGGVFSGTITHSEISYNEAASAGGGVYASDIRHCEIIGNRARDGGGVQSGNAWNCLIADNEGTQSSGGANSSHLHNCTVIFNSAMEAGGAAGGTCENTILYYNEAMRGPNWMISGVISPPAFSYSCTTPLPEGGIGNFNDEPGLAGMRQAHLLPGSPCIGAGVIQDWMAGATDCDGEPRLDGASVDVGWDQLWSDDCADELAIAIGFPNGRRVAPGMALPMYADDDAGRPLSIVWDLGDGSFVTNAAWTTHAWQTAGEKVIALTATNHGFTATATATVVVEMVTQHVAPSGDDANDGASWASPKQTLQAAVDASIYGGLVLVSNGVYDTGARSYGGLSNSNRVILTNAITLRGVNGPGVTFIAGQPGPTTNDASAISCVLMGPHTRLEGVTLTNGHTGHLYERHYGGGAYCMDNTAVISNCVITSCSGWNGGGGVYQGTLYNSHIENCRASSGGGAYDARLNNSIIRDNRARNYYGGGVYGGTAQNCLITGNQSEDLGGGAYASDLLNCTVAGNNNGLEGGFALNCIVYDNAGGNWNTGDSSTYRYTCTTPLPEGIGCITENPLFMGDYRLASNSPCVNRGSNQAWMAGATDLAGSNRIQNAVVDMGAFEFAGWGMVSDVDSDGFPDWTEVYVLGTDPTDASSFLGMSQGDAMSGTLTGIVVRWRSEAGILYNVERSTNLVEEPLFSRIMTGVAGQPDSTSVTDTTTTVDGPCFYRVGITH